MPLTVHRGGPPIFCNPPPFPQLSIQKSQQRGERAIESFEEGAESFQAQPRPGPVPGICSAWKGYVRRGEDRGDTNGDTRSAKLGLQSAPLTRTTPD